jgi:hypothetical protein
MNKSCTICSRYKETLRCCVKGCKDDLCEDCVHFLRVILETGADYTEVFLLPMCYRHAPFVRDAMRTHPEAMERERLLQWLEANVTPVNHERLMRFINAASGHTHTLH